MRTALQLPRDDAWDVVLVGDGSGSHYGYPGGWGVKIYDRLSDTSAVLWGGLSDTTVNVCELSPYVYGLLWHVHNHGKDHWSRRVQQCGPGVAPEPLKTYVLTDCAIIAAQGSQQAERLTNEPLWRSLESCKFSIYDVTWVYQERDQTNDNRLCDILSKASRKAIAPVFADNLNSILQQTDKHRETAVQIS